MSALGILTRKITAFFLGIVSIFRGLMCFLHIVRKRRNSGMLLPMTEKRTFANSVASDGIQGEVQQSLPSNNDTLESWDGWDDQGFGASVGAQYNANIPSGPQQPAHGLHSNNVRSGYHRNQPPEPEPEPEPDYFQDMTPSLRRPTKILVKKKEDVRSSGPSSRLAMATDMVPMSLLQRTSTILTGSELETWDEAENAWGDEITEDLSEEAQSALRATRQAERQHRQMEQQRRKMEKEALRLSRSRDGQLAAVKLS